MSDLDYSVKDQVATLTMNRPERLNAISPEMQKLWKEHFAAAQDDDEVRVIVLTGAGKAFCSGGDLQRRTQAGAQPEPVTPLVRKTHLRHATRMMAAVKEVDKPIIAAVNGAAAGAGMDAALMCDIRFAARSARFTEAYVKVGLMPGEGGCYFLPRLVSVSKALHLLWTGDFVGAEEAEKIGLVDAVYDDDKLMEQTLVYARRLAGMPPVAVRMIKRTVYQSLNLDFRTHIDLLSSHMAIVTSMEDSKEALAAFKEKRPGRYKNR